MGNKISLFLECHTIVIWTIITGAFYIKHEYLLALVTSVFTAWFLYTMVTRLLTRYVAAMIDGIVASAELIRKEQTAKSDV
jgi:hypothetical protein